MAGGITYDGIQVVNGGQIFDGLKFWIAQRVPTRSTIIDHIQTNSGTVVPLEKHADYLIADHARKDAPSGAISWKFITESVQNGVVQIPDRYNIAQAPAGPRVASSNRPTKATRTMFTTEEDETLASWVLAHGNYKTGNEIYKEFETMYPTHPWQSWRNRYVKKLSLLSHDSFLQMAARGANHSALQSTGAQAQDQELPDPAELMLQRKGLRVQKETALQRTKERTERVDRKPAALPAPPTPPVLQQQTVEETEVATTTARNQFYEDLQWYSEENGTQTAPTQQVAGQPVELWELSKAVSVQNLPAEEIDWLQVAEDLGYTWLDVDAAVSALQRCYEENLAEFLEVMQDAFDDGQPEEEEPELAEAEAEAVAAGSNMPPSSRANLPSSPPARFLASKRGFDAELDLDPPLPTKRRRLNLPDEIPSTPETYRGKHTTPNTSRRIRVPTTPLPNLQTAESDFEVTPSQQLLSEHINSSPIPLRLNNSARNRQVGRESAAASSSKQSNTSVKRRELPSQFKPRQSAIAKEQQQQPQQQHYEEEESLFVHDGGNDERDELDQPFPGAFASEQPTPRPPIGRPAQVTAARRRKTPDEELADLIQHYESLGYAHKTVVEGLRRTTMTPGLATVVMQSIQEGKGVPMHYEGIWTDRDDEGLRLVKELGDVEINRLLGSKEEMKKIRKARRTRDRLREKHGEERMTLRMKFLEANDAVAAAEEQSS